MGTGADGWIGAFLLAVERVLGVQVNRDAPFFLRHKIAPLCTTLKLARNRALVV